MVALCLGVEHLAGLLQLLGGDRRQEVAKEVKVVKEDAKEIRMVKERGQDDEERRQAVIKDQLHVLSTQVNKTLQGAKTTYTVPQSQGDPKVVKRGPNFWQKGDPF